MKSGTSFFNFTVLRRDLTRFAPVWGGYLAALLLLVLSIRSGNAARTAYSLLDMPEHSALLLLYAPVCAGTLFGDLYQHRLCAGLHAMPLRREQWFAAHLLAGFLFFLLPTLLFCGLMLLFTGAYGYTVALWLVIRLLQFLFFFGTAVFSALCAGNRLGMVAVYSFLNFGGLLIPGFAKTVIAPLLYGVELTFKGFAPFAPPVQLENMKFVDFVYHYESKTAAFNGLISRDWRYLILLAGIGLVLTVCALFLYRRRRLETAGQLLAVRWLSPAFPPVLALALGVLLSALGDSSRYGLLFLGLCAGFLGGHMLLQHSVRIFQWKRFLRLGILLAAAGLVILAAKVDLFGIVRRIPQPEKVQQVTVTPYSATGKSVTLRNREDIQTMLALHAHALAERADSAEHITLTYTLTNGTSFTRRYSLCSQVDTDGDGIADSPNPHLQAVERIFSRWQVVFRTEDWTQFQKRVAGIWVDDIYFPMETKSRLLDAIYADCAAGTISLNYRKGIRRYRVEVQVASLSQANTWEQLTLFIYEDSIHTLNCIADLVAEDPANLGKVKVYPQPAAGGAQP